MDNNVCLRAYAAAQLDRREILRYAGVRGNAPEAEALLEDCVKALPSDAGGRVCYRVMELEHHSDGIGFGGVKIRSSALVSHFESCSEVVVFAATVGLELDRLISRYSSVSPTKALMYQAIGAERIESLCDSFERDIIEEYRKKGYTAHSRFSPGYSDFPLEAQRYIFALLDCPRKIGLSLNESLVMTPSKSVTALIGLSKST